MQGLVALQRPAPCLEKGVGSLYSAQKYNPAFLVRGHARKLVTKCSVENAKTSAAGIISSALLSLSIAQSAVAADGTVDPIIDRANVIPDAQEKRLNASIRDFEDRTGWKISYVLPAMDPDARPGGGAALGNTLADTWAPDVRTVVVDVNPLSPNILDFIAGADVKQLLPRQFFLELQGKYGNMFFVREEGEAAAAEKSVLALQTCLQRDNGCMSVPELDSDLYGITTICSLLGGFVAGYALRLGPQPLAGNTGAFLIGGAFVYFSALFKPEKWGGTGSRKTRSNRYQKKRQ
eukprot:jgi/Mesvir1/20547/Mv04311-RA.1